MPPEWVQTGQRSARHCHRQKNNSAKSRFIYRIPPNPPHPLHSIAGTGGRINKSYPRLNPMDEAYQQTECSCFCLLLRPSLASDASSMHPKKGSDFLLLNCDMVTLESDWPIRTGFLPRPRMVCNFSPMGFIGITAEVDKVFSHVCSAWPWSMGHSRIQRPECVLLSDAHL